MPTLYDAVDLRWTWDGDFYPGPDGDFADTFSDQIESLVEQIQTVTQSELGDWREHPSFAATLSDYVGEPNTRDKAKEIRDRVFTALVSNGVVSASDLVVRVAPMDIHTVLIVVGVLAAAAPTNSLEVGQRVQVRLLFDYAERGVMLLDMITPPTIP